MAKRKTSGAKKSTDSIASFDSVAELRHSTSEVVIYKPDGGDVQLDVRLDHETVWLNQAHQKRLAERGLTEARQTLDH